MAIPLTPLLALDPTVGPAAFDLDSAIADLRSHRPVSVPTVTDAAAVLSAFGLDTAEVDTVLGRSAVKDVEAKVFDPTELRDLLGRWSRSPVPGPGGVGEGRFRLALTEPDTEATAGLRKSARHVTAAKNAREVLGDRPFHRTAEQDEEVLRYRALAEESRKTAAKYQRGIDRNEVIPSHLDRAREGVPLGSPDDFGGLHLTAEQYAQERDKRIEAAERFDALAQRRIGMVPPSDIDGDNARGLGSIAQQHLAVLLHTGKVIEREAQRRAAERERALGVDEESILKVQRDLVRDFDEINRKRMDTTYEETERLLAERGLNYASPEANEVRAEAVEKMSLLHPELMKDYQDAREAGLALHKHQRAAATARKDLLVQARLEVLREIRPMGPGKDGGQRFVLDSLAVPGHISKTIAMVKPGDVLKGSSEKGDMEVVGVSENGVMRRLNVRDEKGEFYTVNLNKNWMAAVRRPEGEHDRPSAEDTVALKSLAQAEQFYPTAWLDASRDRSEINVTVTDRGFFNQDENRIALSGLVPGTFDGPVTDEGLRVATHETGHRMEQIVEGLKAAQWAYYLTRTSKPSTSIRYGLDRSGKNALQTVPTLPDDEPTRPDKFPNAYSGKEYSGGTASSAYELFTTAVESVLGRSDYADDGMTQFTLGVLAVLPGGNP